MAKTLGETIRKMPLGTIFEWNGRMWRRGRRLGK
jgi:hypothetical protein